MSGSSRWKPPMHPLESPVKDLKHAHDSLGSEKERNRKRDNSDNHAFIENSNGRGGAFSPFQYIRTYYCAYWHVIYFVYWFIGTGMVADRGTSVPTFNRIWCDCPLLNKGFEPRMISSTWQHRD